MRLIRYFTAGLAQFLVACGGIVFVEPFCRDPSCFRDASTDQSQEMQSVSDAQASESEGNLHDVYYPICPTLGGHCEFDSSTSFYCASDTTVWVCVADVWYEEPCSNATQHLNPLCDTSGTNCIGQRCH